jgi:hypothetical protein
MIRRRIVSIDAVNTLTSTAAGDDLVKEATARDFLADALQHRKSIGYDQSALPPIEKAGTDISRSGSVRRAHGSVAGWEPALCDRPPFLQRFDTFTSHRSRALLASADRKGG